MFKMKMTQNGIMSLQKSCNQSDLLILLKIKKKKCKTKEKLRVQHIDILYMRSIRHHFISMKKMKYVKKRLKEFQLIDQIMCHLGCDLVLYML